MIVPFMYIDNMREKTKYRKKDQGFNFGWIDIDTVCKQLKT